jgi:hypothetical protein
VREEDDSRVGARKVRKAMMKVEAEAPPRAKGEARKI